MTPGVNELEKQLQDLGFTTERPRKDIVAFPFTIPCGRFRGRVIHIALHAPQFPNVPPHGPYIKPHLFSLQSGDNHPNGGIHNQNTPSHEWQLWSRPIPEWDQSDKSVKTYLAFLRRLFDFT